MQYQTFKTISINDECYRIAYSPFFFFPFHLVIPNSGTGPQCSYFLVVLASKNCSSELRSCSAICFVHDASHKVLKMFSIAVFAVHELLGLKGSKFQSLYHFTVGAPVLDKRIMSLPAYPGPGVDA